MMTSRWLFMLATLASLTAMAAIPTQAQNADPAAATSHLLAIGVCPPYRENIPVEVCRNAVDAMVDNLPEALGIDAANVTALTDEQTTGQNVLAVIADLAGTVEEGDRLVIYLLLHGDAFYQWASYYRSGPVVDAVNEAYYRPKDDLMVFWTEAEPTVPALALAEKDWMSVNDFVVALEAIPGKVALILDSCSSALFFSSIHDQAHASETIDYVLTSSGPVQVSNFDEAVSIPLFASQLRDALNLPLVRTFGEAVEQARISTTLQAAALCSMTVVPEREYEILFPTLPPPAARTHDGLVSLPLWQCAQVPSVFDASGELTAWPLYGGARLPAAVPARP